MGYITDSTYYKSTTSGAKNLPTDKLFQVRLVENEAEEYETDSGEEEEWWHPEVKQGEKVQVSNISTLLFVTCLHSTLCVFRYFSPGMGR